ncbi:MAG: hypothetical protein ABSB01_17360 [Streptosporangiaceae bacterium]|jgi:hypothetical protein
MATTSRMRRACGVDNQEQGAPVWVCSRLRATWAAIWPGLRDLG